MAECEYYEEDFISIPSRVIRKDRQRPPPSVTKVPWCAHPKHSTVDRKTVRGTVGGGRLLQCGGDRDSCKLSAEQFEDVFTEEGHA